METIGTGIAIVIAMAGALFGFLFRWYSHPPFLHLSLRI